MQHRTIMHVVSAIFALCALHTQNALAETRLGLHVTQEELNIWRQRRTDNTNGVNGVTYQTIYQNRIQADADAFKAQSHPEGDGYWVGWDGPGCNDDAVRWTPPRNDGQQMVASAFHFLLTG